MYADEVNQYYQAVTALEAQEVLTSLQVAVFPYLKGKQEQNKFIRRIEKLAWYHEQEEVKLNPVEEAVKMLQQVGKNGRR